MAIILDTWDEIFIAGDAAELMSQLVEHLPVSPTDELLTDLAAVVLECDTLDIIITRTSGK